MLLIRNGSSGNRVHRLDAHRYCNGGGHRAYVTHYDRAYKDLFKDMFLLVSKFGKFFGWQIRLGNVFGSKHVRARLMALASYWTKAGRS